MKAQKNSRIHFYIFTGALLLLGGATASLLFANSASQHSSPLPPSSSSDTPFIDVSELGYCWRLGMADVIGTVPVSVEVTDEQTGLPVKGYHLVVSYLMPWGSKVVEGVTDSTGTLRVTFDMVGFGQWLPEGYHVTVLDTRPSFPSILEQDLKGMSVRDLAIKGLLFNIVAPRCGLPRVNPK